MISPEPARDSWTRSTRLLLLVLAAATIAAPPPSLPVSLPLGPTAVTGALAAGIALAAIGPWIRTALARLVASAAFTAWVAQTLLAHPEQPGRGLALLLGLVALLAHLWPTGGPPTRWQQQRGPNPARPLILGSAVAVLVGFGDWDSARPTLVEELARTAVDLLPVLFAWRVAEWRRSALRMGLLVFCTLLGLLPFVALAGVTVVEPFAMGTLAPSMILLWASRRDVMHWLAPAESWREPGMLDVVLAHPSRVLVLSFLAICVVGATLLRLPMVTASGEPLSWLDAAFTGVSATCVTGLIVVDTPVAFGPLGQAVVLCLIQVGGLGIMAFSAAGILLLGRRMSLSHERAAVDLLGASSRSGLRRALGTVLVVTVVVETVAALLLFAAFLWEGDPIGTAAWRAVFTAISAFCNAGFALQSDSLVPYAESPMVLSVVAVTIVLGGLGPPVVAALVTRRRRARVSVHTKLVLATSVVLLVVPAVMIAALEWSSTLDGLAAGDKLMNAAFQSVTLRTAGFNSIDLAQVQPATWTVMVLMMFVGGSPGSTAGGVKTTSIAVVVLGVLAVIRGKSRIEIFGRTIPLTTVLRGAAVVTLGVLSCAAALIAVQLTQAIPLDVALFEVVSALATVGLSTGGTGALDEVGKLIIIACMFAGRVGPLTLFVLLVSQARAGTERTYPEEDVPVG